ncbi:hypothetical protein BGZ72_004571 [Mortierella alpina]|nr:hypothetical protein BGZ72_004571 [Mortierella alpina]
MQKPLIAFHKSSRLPRLIVTDLDGTLLTPQHTISRRSVDALLSAQQYNLLPAQDDCNLSCSAAAAAVATASVTPIQIMIASGRSPRSVQKVIDLFNGLMMPDTVLCCNGALSYNPKTRTISYPQFVPLPQARLMVERLRTEIIKHCTPRSQIPIKDLPEDLKDMRSPENNTSVQPCEPQAKDGNNINNNDEEDEKEEIQQSLLVPGRPGFACEVIWFEKGLSSNGIDPIYAQDTSFVCDRTWESQRKHTFYYEYTVVDDTMEQFLASLEGRGGVVKLLALDRNRAAPALYESLPESLRPTSDGANTTSTTNTTTTSAPMTVPEPQATLTYSGDYFLEISAAGVNKGLGLQKYCEANQIAQEDVVAFGDLLNDAEMLQFAGLGLCMGNGHEDMKKLADRVIGTNAEDGLAKEVESWFL